MMRTGTFGRLANRAVSQTSISQRFLAAPRSGPRAPRRKPALTRLAKLVGCIAVLLATLPSALRAQTFQAIPQLHFTKAYAGANPLPQVITVASTSSNFNFYASVVNATGGNWLSISQSTGCCAATPQAITVNANPDVTLAAGDYSASIVFTSQDGTKVRTVPVSLTVAPSSVPLFDNLAGALTFSMLTSGSAPPSQPLGIRNAGAGTLHWTATATTSDGGNWLTLSASSGTAPSILSVGVNPALLPGTGLVAGTYTGQVLLQTDGDSVTVPVTFTVGASVFRQLNPLSFTKAHEQADPPSQVITVASTGTNFNFYAAVVNATGGNWLSISQSTGCCAATPQAITVSVMPDITLAAGTYTAEIILKSQNGGEADVIPVSLTIAPSTSTFFDALAGELTFSLVTGGNVPSLQDLPIRNAGTDTLDFTATSNTADGGHWITLSSSSGTAPSVLSVGVNPANLPGQGLIAGTFVGQVVLQTASDTVTVPVTVTVGSAVFRQLNPLSFTKRYAGANPLSQVITVSSTGANFNFYAAVVNGTGGNWLSISQSTGCCAATPQAITVTVNPDITLAAGTYTAEIIFKSQDTSQASVVPVTLTVAASDAMFFDSLPGELTFSMLTGGPAPPSQPVPIRNAGSGSLDWTAASSTSDGGAWLTLSAQSGNAPSTLHVGINPANLPGGGLVAGTFVGQIVLTTGGDRVTVPVTVSVGASVFRQINALSFTKPYTGANPLSQVFTVASTGANFNFYAAVVNGTGGNWLSISQSTGCCAATPQAITATVNPDITLAAGTYTAEIVLKSQDTSQASVIPVCLVVAPASAAFFDNLPGALTFSATPSGTAPPSQPLQIRNGGAGTLSWTASAITSDGGNWLTVSPQSGSAPSVLGVSVNPANLPGAGLVAGTFTGQVLLETAGDSVTVPVTFAVGNPVFVQVSPLTFSKASQGANPPTQTLTVASTGANFNFYAAVVNGSGGNWLSISQSTGCCAATPQTITVKANPDVTLADGTYTAEIIFKTQNGSEAMVVAVTLTVGNTPLPVAATPVFSLAAGTYTSAQTVSITDVTPGAAIHYTTDGSTPTASSPTYTGPVTVSSTETLTAIATAPGYTQSPAATAAYTLVPVTVSPAALVFPSQGVGTTSTASTLTFTNPGANTLSGISLSIFGTNASDFNLLSNGCDTTLAAGASCTLSITFSPHAAGSSSATLHISYPGIGSPLGVALSGTGAATSSGITLTPSPGIPTYGQSLTVTATLSGSPAPTGTLSYQLDGGPAQTVTLAGGSAVLPLGVLPAGSHTLVVTYAGDATYAPATQSLNVTVARAPLTVTANNLSRPFGQANPPLTYSITGFKNGDTSASLGGSAILTTSATATSPTGSYPITFSTQSLSSANYTFTYVPGTLTVTVAGQTITFAPLGNLTVGATVTLSATASSGLPVSYTVSGPATLSGSTLTVTGTGTISVTASQAGNANYSAAPSVAQTTTVGASIQTITFTGLPATAVFGAAGPYTLNASASSGLPVTYTVSGPATLSGSTLTITGVGIVTVTASQAGNSTYNAAAPVTQTISITAPSPSTAQLILTSSVASQSDGSYLLTITITNTSANTVNNVALNSVLLGAVSATPTPQAWNSIAPGTSVVATAPVPASAGAPGSHVIERIAGTYTGGIFGGSYRITLP